MAKRVVLTGGLSGGHTYPLIAVARALRTEMNGDVEFLFIGSRGKFETEAMAQEGIRTKFIVTAKWRRYFSFQNFIDIFKLPVAFIQSLWHLLIFMPDAVFSKGGAASVPIGVAAWIYRIPILLHDSDAVAGKANRFVGKLATRIAIAYTHAAQFFPPHKVALTGNPVREELLHGNPQQGRESCGFVSDRPVILVVGGSLGAQRLNESILLMLPELIASSYQVLHITGESNLKAVQERAVAIGIEPNTGYIALPFLSASELAGAYAMATIVISRAGAGSIAELAALAKCSILVPLASAANNEQRLNAYEVAHEGGAIVIEEPNLGGHILKEYLAKLVGNPSEMQRMGEILHAKYYHPEAAETLARGLMSLY